MMDKYKDSYYNDIASGYNELYGKEQQTKLEAVYNRIVKKGLVKEGAALLDVGCGSGLSTDFFAEKFACRATGVDPSHVLIATNQKKKSEFVVGVAEKLPFLDNSFDVIVSFSSIQNFAYPQIGLEEMKRVGNSIFILTVMNRGDSFDMIHPMIKSMFTVREEFAILNDTVYIIY